MLNLRKGFSVTFADKLNEGYKSDGKSITANVSAEKTLPLLEQFIKLHEDEKLFFVLELPTPETAEPKDENGNITAFHKDIYYLDDCSPAMIRDVLDIVGEILLDDGISQFGVGSHITNDEMMICKYNIVNLYRNDEQSRLYDGFFENIGIDKTDNLVTAWNMITSETPGECTMCEKDGRTVYDIPSVFAELGMYMAERREV
ncbi:MAG: hypothetical protein J6L61_02160 [Ruminiclostridium sp.]|nr:hypothetical protein [Ruminiclostridium sp.]